MASGPQKKAASIPDFVDELQRSGRYTFARKEAEAATDAGTNAVEAALRRLKSKRRIVSPRTGFYVVVPLEYGVSGGPPADWFIDALMAHLGQPYYVGLLSAAALFGAAHQQPMVFQVVSDRATRPAKAGRVRIEFHKSRSVARTPTDVVATETGTMRVSTVESTALDLVRFANAAGHLDNVVTVLQELAERMDASRLAVAAATYAAPTVQRLGYLLDFIGRGDLAEGAAKSLEGRRFRPVDLAPAKPSKDTAPDPRWRVSANVVPEPDV